MRIFRGEQQLATALLDISTTPAVTGSAVIVQDFARNDFELRQFVVDGRIVHKVYSNFVWVDADGYMLRESVDGDRALRDEARRDKLL